MDSVNGNASKDNYKHTVNWLNRSEVSQIFLNHIEHLEDKDMLLILFSIFRLAN